MFTHRLVQDNNCFDARKRKIRLVEPEASAVASKNSPHANLIGPQSCNP